MSILIEGISSLKEGLYQVQDGKIHAYKGNGGKVQEFDLIEAPKPQNRPATWGDVSDSLKVLETLLETIEAEEGETKIE